MILYKMERGEVISLLLWHKVHAMGVLLDRQKPSFKVDARFLTCLWPSGYSRTDSLKKLEDNTNLLVRTCL